MSSPASASAGLTYLMSSASWARFASSQKAAGPVALWRAMPSWIQSRIGAFFAVAERQMSPFSTACSCSTSPLASTIRTVPSAGSSKVVGCEPYSSAFCAIRPTFDTAPAVVTSSAPVSLKKLIASS